MERAGQAPLRPLPPSVITNPHHHLSRVPTNLQHLPRIRRQRRHIGMNRRGRLITRQLPEITRLPPRHGSRSRQNRDRQIRIVGIQYLHLQPVFHAIVVAQDDGRTVDVDAPCPLQYELRRKQHQESGIFVIRRQGDSEAACGTQGIDSSADPEGLLLRQVSLVARHGDDALELHQVVDADIADALGRELHSRRSGDDERAGSSAAPVRRGDLEYGRSGNGVTRRAWELVYHLEFRDERHDSWAGAFGIRSTKRKEFRRRSRSGVEVRYPRGAFVAVDDDIQPQSRTIQGIV